jgi:NADH dehydrogenase [ubiquinone] 1 alpha subcomplex assembly factor 3
MRQPWLWVVVVERTVVASRSVHPVCRTTIPAQRHRQFFMLSTVLRSQNALRALHTSTVLRNQKWSQLTNILASEIPPPVQVKSITAAGLLLQDGRLLPSACIFLEGEVLLWDVPPNLWNGWDESKFEVFDVVVPKPGACASTNLVPNPGNSDSSLYSPEILLVGTGKSVAPLPTPLRQYLNKLGIQVDVMDSVEDPPPLRLLSY